MNASTTLRRLGPWVTALVLLALWGLLAAWLALPTHLFPPPLEVLQRLVEGLLTQRHFWPQLVQTLIAALGGLLVGSVAALALAMTLVHSPRLERMVAPLLAGLQATPKTALAPIVLLWAGMGLSSITWLVALISFFPVFVNALAGLKAAPIELLDLHRACGASSWHVLRHLRLPTALPFLLTGLQVALGFALVGACVMEFLIGTGGMGFLIQDSANRLDTATGVAAMVVLGLAGAVLSLALRRLRRRVVFWEAVR